MNRRIVDDVAVFRQELDALNRASRQKDPFSSVGFLESYTRCDPRASNADSEPWFLIAFERGMPAGYLPLRRSVERVLGLPRVK